MSQTSVTVHRRLRTGKERKKTREGGNNIGGFNIRKSDIQKNARKDSTTQAGRPKGVGQKSNSQGTFQGTKRREHVAHMPRPGIGVS